MMKAPIPSIISDITCLLTGCPPLSGPSSMCHLCSSIPPTPSGLSSSWLVRRRSRRRTRTSRDSLCCRPACSCGTPVSGCDPVAEVRHLGVSIVRIFTIRRSGAAVLPPDPALLYSARPREPNARSVASCRGALSAPAPRRLPSRDISRKTRGGCPRGRRRRERNPGFYASGETTVGEGSAPHPLRGCGLFSMRKRPLSRHATSPRIPRIGRSGVDSVRPTQIGEPYGQLDASEDPLSSFPAPDDSQNPLRGRADDWSARDSSSCFPFALDLMYGS